MLKRALGEIGILTLGVALMVGLVYLEVKAIKGILEIGEQARPPGFQESTRERLPEDQARYSFHSRVHLANALLVFVGGVMGGFRLIARARRFAAATKSGGQSIVASVDVSAETSFLTRPGSPPAVEANPALSPDRNQALLNPEKRSF